ncbi:MAG: PKD domain-containing protein [Bacteroidia bacterium]
MFCDSVTVILPAPSCNASFMANINAGTGFFIANPGFMPGWSYTWDFGDGNFGTGSFTQHVYTASEEYLVCLTVYDSLTSCTYTTCELVDVDINCTASFTATTDSLTVNFIGQPIGFGNSYIWNFGDSQFTTTQFPFTSHTYNAPGTYNICMNVTTASGSNCTFCDQVTVTLPPTGIIQNEIEFTITLYPNPTKEIINLIISGNLSNKAELQIADYTGRIITSEKINLLGNQNILVLPISYLQSGVYFILFKHEGNSKTLRFVKQ